MRESKPLGLILLFICFGLVGQYLYKAGVASPEMSAIIDGLNRDWQTLTQGQFIGLWDMVVHSVQLVINPYCFMGLVCYAMSTVCWLAVLSKVDLSFAYPMISIGYVAVLLMSALGFGEEVTLLRWMGVLLIGVGIISIYSEEWFAKWGMFIAGGLLLLAAALLGMGQDIKPADAFEKPVLFLAVCLSLGIIGQILFKCGMNKEVNKQRVAAIGTSVKAAAKAPAQGVKAVGTALALFFSPFVFGGLAAYGLSTILWVMLLKVVPLSFLYPLLSVGYVVILLISVFFFHEHVSFLRWYGVVTICYGIVIIFAEELISAHLGVFVTFMVIMALSLGGFIKHQRNKLSAKPAA